MQGTRVPRRRRQLGGPALFMRLQCELPQAPEAHWGPQPRFCCCFLKGQDRLVASRGA